jgi:hypothetical protein
MMNRSALNAEVQYRLRMQERARAEARSRNTVPEMEEEADGFFARLLARRRKRAERRATWLRRSRPLPGSG